MGPALRGATLWMAVHQSAAFLPITVAVIQVLVNLFCVLAEQQDVLVVDWSVLLAGLRGSASCGGEAGAYPFAAIGECFTRRINSITQRAWL